MPAPSKSAPSDIPADAQLVSACRRGEKRAFVEIVARHQAMVCGVAFAILNDFAASEDAAQEAFLTAWRKIQELRDPTRLRPWLAQIARNAALAQLRRHHPTDALDNASDLSDPAAKPDESAASEEEAQLVRAALEQLPEHYRLPLILFYREDQSVRAVAESLGISEDAVKQRLARGREMLRDRVESTLGGVLARSGPSAVFTMTIAAAIGALAAPSAIAASAFAAAGTTTATASTSTSVFTAMGTTKILATAAAVLAIASIPVGYHLAEHLGGAAPAAPESSAALQRTSNAQGPPSYENNALFAEWRALHEKYGTNAAAMPELYRAIQGLSEAYRRRAFTAAQIAEWARLDPANGLAFFQQKKRNSDEARQFFSEWFSADPSSALNGLLSGDPTQTELARSSLKEIARRFPERLASLVSIMPAPESFFSLEVQDAFSVLAERDLSAARIAAEAVTGPNRDRALGGIAAVWAKTDLDQTIAWAKTLPADNSEIIRAALIRKASVDPSAALELVSIVPSSPSSPGYSHITTGRRVLEAAATANFDETVSWLKSHPGRLAGQDLDGLGNTVTARLNADAIANLQTWAAEGSLGMLAPAIGSALMNSGSGMREVIWPWLKDQPADNDFIPRLRQSVFSSAAYHDPEFAFTLAKDIPQSAQGASELDYLAGGLLNGGNSLNRFEEFAAKAPENLRGPLFDYAFHHVVPDNIGNPAKWIALLKNVPPEQVLSDTESLAHGFAWSTPEEAMAWAESLADPPSRAAALAGAISGTARTDVGLASQWLDDLPPGREHDLAAAALVKAMVKERVEAQPREAWQWASTISDSAERERAAAQVVNLVAERDPNTAAQWIQSGPFTVEKKAELQRALGLKGVP